MNIQEAREEIIRSVKAYTARDEQGCFRVPQERQRPLLLMGPPGIGKTAIAWQAAEICSVGMVSYAMTHHTRQSAVGLPELVRREFDGKEYTATEYTLSEIVASLYSYMKESGHREGILFLDEINCVSETLLPTMLQLLQFKTFGTHRIPEGWVIVAAGNPPEFNRAARELDMAALDRVRTLEIEADFGVWKDYALPGGVHPAILSYLEMKPEQFYRVTLTREKSEFVTARGWEDLSSVLKEYERQGLAVTHTFVEEFLRSRETAADFDAYYRLYLRCMGTYRIPELLDGCLTLEETSALKEELKAAGMDVRCMFIQHLLAAASQRMTALGEKTRRLKRLREVLERYASAGLTPEEFLRQREHERKVKKEYGLLKEAEERIELWADLRLREILGKAGEDTIHAAKTFTGKEEAGDAVKTADYPHSKSFAVPFVENADSVRAAERGRLLAQEEETLKEERAALCIYLDQMTDFVAEIFGEGEELADWLLGLRRHSDFAFLGFDRPEFASLQDTKSMEQRLIKQIKETEELYETADRV
ncbi:MAG: AAA family ATPase [Lachnospiraceae bacterium]|nr:AAA family ATPase [Lachnospiraceae bacterium]